MVNVDFNMQTLKHYQNSSDEMYSDLAQQCIDDFTEYGGIVIHFDKKMDNWRKTKSGEEYRNLVQKLDKKRRLVHDNCLHDIDIINRMASSDEPPQKPFATWENGTTVNRTDIGNAIVEQCYEQIRTGLEPKKSKENSITKTRDTMNDYNFMLGFTKYPMVKKDGKYQFVDLFSQKEVPYKTVENYIQGRTQDKDKLQQLTKANELIAQQNTPSPDEPEM